MSKHHHVDDGDRKAFIELQVRDKGGDRRHIANASVGLRRIDAAGGGGDNPPMHVRRTDDQGRVRFEHLDPSQEYEAVYLHEPKTSLTLSATSGDDDCGPPRALEVDVCAYVETTWLSRDCQPLDCRSAQVGDVLNATIHYKSGLHPVIVGPVGAVHSAGDGQELEMFATTANRPGVFRTAYEYQFPGIDNAHGGQDALIRIVHEHEVTTRPAQPVSGQLGIALTRTETEPTRDLPLWVAIRNGTEALSFNRYLQYMDVLFGHRRHHGGNGASKGSGRGNGHRFEDERAAFEQLKNKRFLPFNDSDSYRVLKAATEAFVMVNCGVLNVDEPHKLFRPQHDNAYLRRRDLPAIDDMAKAFDEYLDEPGGILPYLELVRRKLPDVPIVEGGRDGVDLDVGFIHAKLANPCLVELIWSYWHEEAMLVQTMNAVTRRFQNQRSTSQPDPLANLEIDPLRPLNNLLWSYAQDEQHRLTLNQRNGEYIHAYGLQLQGRAVRDFRAADSRSQFLEGFHHLLRQCTQFYKQDDDTTIKADAFPVLNALKEVHLVMSQGAHNQFGELPSTSRIEMLMQQWLLGRPEFREFLPSRIMVAYPEPWMDRVDAMKKLQGWTDTSVVHFRNLAIFGEQVLLSIRYGAWSEVYEPIQAFNWARHWRPQVQGYIHAYRAATGIDLSSKTFDAAVDATLPSLLMQRRLAQQQRSA